MHINYLLYENAILRLFRLIKKKLKKNQLTNYAVVTFELKNYRNKNVSLLLKTFE